MKTIIELRPTRGEKIRVTTPSGVVLFVGYFADVLDWVNINHPDAEVWDLCVEEFIPA